MCTDRPLKSAYSIILAVFVAGSASAQSAPMLSDALGLDSLVGNVNDPSTAQIGTFSNNSYTSSTDYRYMTGSVLPAAPLASAYVSGAGTSYYEVTAGLEYQFSINGPANTQVPIDIAINLSTGGSGPNYLSLAHFDMAGQLTNFPITDLTACSVGGSVYNCTGTIGSSFSGILTGTVPSNVTESIFIGGMAIVNNSSSTASADPKINIDSSFANASEYIVALSAGVANSTAPVPGPGTLVMLLAGLGIVVSATRRGARRSRCSTRNPPSSLLR